jgi:hypothetical protein
MSVFGNIMSSIFSHPKAQTAPAAPQQPSNAAGSVGKTAAQAPAGPAAAGASGNVAAGASRRHCGADCMGA